MSFSVPYAGRLKMGPVKEPHWVGEQRSRVGGRGPRHLEVETLQAGEDFLREADSLIGVSLAIGAAIIVVLALWASYGPH